MTEQQRAAMQAALEALDIGLDAARYEAETFHRDMAGYKPHRHAAMDADVKRIEDAIAALRAALAQQEQAEPLRRGGTGVCSRSTCLCEKEGLGDQCIWLTRKQEPEPLIDGYPLYSGLPPPSGGAAMSDNLPPLPEPEHTFYVGKGKYKTFSADQMRTYAAAAVARAVAAERERCAHIADKHATRDYPWGSENTCCYHAQAHWAERIAAVIRGSKHE